MDKTSKIFKKISNKLDVDKLKDVGSNKLGNIFNLFAKKTKKEVVDTCLYKSNMILALSDDSLIVYDMLRLCQTLEINVNSQFIKVYLGNFKSRTKHTTNSLNSSNQ